MIISNCPRCDEGFRVPSGEIPDNAYARCPWCHESYPIAEVLNHLPPELQIVSADGTPLAVDELADGMAIGPPRASVLEVISPSQSPALSAPIEAIVDGVPGDDLEFRDFQAPEIIPPAVNETAPEPIEDVAWNAAVTDGFHADGSASFAAENPDASWDQGSELESMNIGGSSGGRKRRRGAGIGTFIGIVFGGLASVPIAGFLLMLLGRTPDWGFWPFDGGTGSGFSQAAALPLTKAAEPLPAAATDRAARSSLTDPSLRFNNGAPGILDDDETSLQSDLDRAKSEIVDITGKTLTQRSGRGPTTDLPSSAAAGTSDQQPVFSTTEADLLIGSASETNSSITKAVPIAPSNSTAKAMVVESADTESEPASSDSEPNEFSQVAHANTESAALAAKAGQMIEAIARTDSPAAKRRERLGMTYMNIVNSTALVEGPSESLRLLATVIASSPDRDDIGRAGWKWLGAKTRNSDGIALIGRAVVTDGETSLSDESGSSISLTGDIQIADSQKFLILGRLNDQGSALRVFIAEPIQ